MKYISNNELGAQTPNPDLNLYDVYNADWKIYKQTHYEMEYNMGMHELKMSILYMIFS